MPVLLKSGLTLSDGFPNIDAEETASSVSADFARRMNDVHGEAGVEWLTQLPSLLDDCARRWSLKLGRPFAPLSYNYVVPAVRADGSPAVLKVGVLVRELLTEMAALRHMDGHGIARLFESDETRGAMLLERLEPGATLSSFFGPDDERATAVAASVMRKLWRPAPPRHTFPTVADWGEGLKRLRRRFGGGSGPFPAELVDEAERLFEELTNSSAEPVLLHGDLHHDNILSAAREPWLAIDPKGLVGEPAYEAGALLRNHLPPAHEVGRVLARRLDQLAEELAIDRARLRGWGVAQAVLSAWWSVEDNERGWEPMMAFAECLRRA